ncbi:ABC transporter permease subunit, partial [Klebsiella variicola]|uniref:ABC transporter permease subunit n=1 Tax=Klebsiella variicola TaxID=244366 RepID=UPI0021755AF7
MIIFTLRRLLLLLVTLFFLTFIGFSLSYFTPHAPLQGASLWNAWLFWFQGVLHWDFGVSSINGQLISEQLREVFPATMELCILAFGFALLIGIPVGMIAGVMRNKWPDTLISAVALVGFSIPVFWLALLLTLFFSLTLGWFPVSGRFDLLYEVKIFECNLPDELSEEFYNENSWFFENYVYICTKIVFENMFKNTI